MYFVLGRIISLIYLQVALHYIYPSNLNKDELFEKLLQYFNSLITKKLFSLSINLLLKFY